MNYFVLCIQNYIEEVDGSTLKKSLYVYDNETEAVARFHSFLGGYMGGDNIASILATVIDGKAAQIAEYYWEADDTTEDTTETTTEDTTEDTTETTE